METPVPPSGRVERRTDRRLALFICGSLNQTTQAHQIAQCLPEVRARYTPYYTDGLLDVFRRFGWLDFTVAGDPWRAVCESYLRDHHLPIDYGGRRNDYDLVFTLQDAVVPSNTRGRKMILVQEGMTDPEDVVFEMVKRFRFLPRWLCSTAATGLSDAYDRFCVASEGYRDQFVRKGVKPEKIRVTGIPNFDNCARYRNNTIAEHGYVLVCTSDGRETFKRDDRDAFLRRAVSIANGRRLIFKLHPNEKMERAEREIRARAPHATILTEGSAEELVANCATLIVEWSTLAYVGLALGKQVYSNFDVEELRHLLPDQHGRAARNIADVARELLGISMVTETSTAA